MHHGDDSFALACFEKYNGISVDGLLKQLDLIVSGLDGGVLNLVFLLYLLVDCLESGGLLIDFGSKRI